MRHAKEELSAPASPVTTLLVAWVIVVGLAFAPVGMIYQRSGDIRFLLSFSGAAFIIGLALFIAMWLGRAGARGGKRRLRTEPGEVSEIANLHKRGAIFGKR